MIRPKSIFVLLAALTMAKLSWSQDLGGWTDSYVKGLAPAKHFSGTIVAEKNGQVLIQKSYGAAVEGWQIPNSPETKFEIASLSKQFTAAAILQLADAGKLNVEDPVSKYYPESPAAWKGMTIHHLLTHTSGLPENEWENFYKVKPRPTQRRNRLKLFVTAPWVSRQVPHGSTGTRSTTCWLTSSRSFLENRTQRIWLIIFSNP